MAIDPIYIALEDVPDFAARRRHGRADGRVARRPRGREGVRARGLCARASHQGRGARAGVRSVLSRRVGAAVDARGRAWRLHFARALVARRLGAVRGAGRVAAPAGLARLAGAAARSASGRASTRRAGSWRTRCCGSSICSGSPTSSGTARGSPRGTLGVTVFGDMPFMVLAESPDVWARPDEFMFDVSLGVPPDAFSETGQDWALPDVPMGPHRGDRLRVDAPARATDGRAVRRLSRRSSGRVVPDLRPADHRRAVLQSGDRTGADRARRGDPPDSARGRRVDHRRRSRRGA